MLTIECAIFLHNFFLLWTRYFHPEIDFLNCTCSNPAHIIKNYLHALINIDRYQGIAQKCSTLVSKARHFNTLFAITTRHTVTKNWTIKLGLLLHPFQCQHPTQWPKLNYLVGTSAYVQTRAKSVYTKFRAHVFIIVIYISTPVDWDMHLM